MNRAWAVINDRRHGYGVICMSKKTEKKKNKKQDYYK